MSQPRIKCETPACDNGCRYTSGLCGVCDVVENGGQGRLLTDRERRMIAIAATQFPAFRHFLHA